MSLKKEIERITGAYCEEAPETVEYPYKVFSMRRLSDSEGFQNYVLEVNVWDKHQYYSRAESIMDELEQDLHRCNCITEDFVIRIFRGQRQNVPDTDKAIKRVREQFEMHIRNREEF